MNKLTILFFCILTFTTCLGQTRFDDSLNIKEFNFFYKDSIEGKVSYGDYEPTGLVCFKDGSLIVSTEFSISFPGQYQMPDSFSKVYFDQQKIFNSKSHVSSGSLFKLNSKFEKQWEIFFKEKRIEGVKKLTDETLLVIGERVDMKLFWMAKVNKEGKIIWEKEFSFKHKPDIQNFEVDSIDNAYVLVGCEKLYPLKICNIYGKKRLRFFQISEMENDQYLLKISPTGKIIWTTTIDNRKNFSAFGHDIILDENIYISTYFEGFVKKKKEWIGDEGRMIYEINRKGKVVNSIRNSNNNLLFYKDSLISCRTSYDTLFLYRNLIPSQELINKIVFNLIGERFIDITIGISKVIENSNSYSFIGSIWHGYFIADINKDFQYIHHWIYKREEYTDFVDAVKSPDGSLILVGKCFKEFNGTNNRLTTYINMVRIKKSGI